ncbi:uncharacterized protein LOC143031369 [Oratosquilla oratoria]|uniref:uncharacterized protein LOC143031369 n=1 Tax=Oratosquilla oratoria TaxID=337810 RepID=UPI003F75A5C2
MDSLCGSLWFQYTAMVLVILMGLRGDVIAIPGTFFTNKELTNKKLPLAGLLVTRVISDQSCMDKCYKHEECDAYALSPLSRTCVLYKVEPGTPPVRDMEFNLYVRQKTKDEGYYTYKTDYLKLNYLRMNSKDAQQECERENGRLVAIRDQGLNDLGKEVLLSHVLFKAFIGVHYDAKEEKWILSDGVPMTFEQWMYNSTRAHEKLACTVITIDGSWREVPCSDRGASFCQIPMF